MAINVCPLCTRGTPSRDPAANGWFAFGRKKDKYCENPMQPDAIESGALISNCQA
jgi:hypothetical protein